MPIVNDYQPIPELTADILPDILVGGDNATKWAAAPTGSDIPLQLGLKDNEIINAINTTGGRVNETIAALGEIGNIVNWLVRNMNWIGTNFENIELIGDRNYLAYVPDREVPDAPSGE